MTTTHSRTLQTRRRKAKAAKKELREAKEVKKLSNAKPKAGTEAKPSAA